MEGGESVSPSPPVSGEGGGGRSLNNQSPRNHNLRRSLGETTWIYYGLRYFMQYQGYRCLFLVVLEVMKRSQVTFFFG